ncbi:hypothetical protein ON010_g4931 [Phytophthora cinnamomi]|nr:hypothetical protein ON010_g4931 [Phytophthora cinnamomi]
MVGGAPISSVVDDDDYETRESCEEIEPENDDLAPYVWDETMADQVKRLVEKDPCEARCLKAKERSLERFLLSLQTMEKVERQTSVLTVISVLISEKYTFLPAYFTWERLYDETSRICCREPARSTMRQLLALHCPDIRIRSPRDNVCEVCSVYVTKMRHGSAASDTAEELGRHTEEARRMRLEHKGDLIATDAEHAVIVMDYNHNLTCPRVPETPSMWYFLSLLSISVFGIYFANDAKQHNYVYDERVDGKGTDQFFLAFVHQGVFERVDYKFFVRGQKKNACDRGFGHIRNRMARVDCWTVGTPGSVVCKTAPEDEGTSDDVRRTINGKVTTGAKVKVMFDQYLETLPPRSQMQKR